MGLVLRPIHSQHGAAWGGGGVRVAGSEDSTAQYSMEQQVGAQARVAPRTRRVGKTGGSTHVACGHRKPQQWDSTGWEHITTRYRRGEVKGVVKVKMASTHASAWCDLWNTTSASPLREPSGRV